MNTYIFISRYIQEFARAQMEQILKKSKISLPDVEIRELAPDRNRKSLAPTRHVSPEPEAESSRHPPDKKPDSGKTEHDVPLGQYDCVVYEP